MSVLAPKVKGVAVRSGKFVDQIIFKFDDNSQIFWGHTGSTTVFGNTRGSLSYWALAEDDYIVQVNVRQGAYVDAIQFVTAKGNVSPFYGGRGGNYKELRAESNCEVLGVLPCRTGHADPLYGLFSRIVGGTIPPMYLCAGNLSQLDRGSSPYNGYTYGGHKQVEMKVVLYRRDLEKALKNPNLDPKVKAAILKVLDFPGVQFVGKIAIGQIVSRALDAGFTGEALPLGLIKQLKTNGFCAGLKGFAVESLQQNSQVFGSIAGVLLAHIVAPIYAAQGKGEEAASLAGGAMIGLGAAIAVPGGAAIAVGLLAPFVIKKIFDIVPKPEEIRAKYRQDMYKMYQTYSEPLSSALAEVDKVKCPNGHYLVDDGPPTLAYLSEDGGPVFRNGCSAYTSQHCTSRDRRWQFKTVRLYCSLCGVCYCEPCMLKHITESAVFTPFQ